MNGEIKGQVPGIISPVVAMVMKGILYLQITLLNILLSID
jgi:hypothetical protein